jgi:hypothetical protein
MAVIAARDKTPHGSARGAGCHERSAGDGHQRPVVGITARTTYHEARPDRQPLAAYRRARPLLSPLYVHARR